MVFEKSKLAPIKLTIDGVDYPAKLTFGALSQIEEACGLNFMTLFDVFTRQKQTAKVMIEMIYGMLIAGGVEVEKEDIAGIEFTNEQYSNINRGIAAALERHAKFVTDLEVPAEKDGSEVKK